MSKFSKINNLIKQYIDEEIDLTIEDIENRCYEYYNNGELEPTAYDYFMGKLVDL